MAEYPRGTNAVAVSFGQGVKLYDPDGNSKSANDFSVYVLTHGEYGGFDAPLTLGTDYTYENGVFTLTNEQYSSTTGTMLWVSNGEAFNGWTEFGVIVVDDDETLTLRLHPAADNGSMELMDCTLATVGKQIPVKLANGTVPESITVEAVVDNKDYTPTYTYENGILTFTEPVQDRGIAQVTIAVDDTTHYLGYVFFPSENA